MSAADWDHVDDRGHCVHCGDQSHCQLQQHRTPDALVGWLAGCCPYNAEAKRIAAGIDQERQRFDAECVNPFTHDAYQEALDCATRIALRT